MSIVPPGWEQTTLGRIGRYVNGRGFKKSEWTTTGRPIIRIQNLTGSSNSFNYFQGQVEKRHVATSGDLLVSWAATLGAFIWDGPEALVNQHIFKVESSIDLKFHKYLLDYKLKELMLHTHGSGMVHITKGQFDAVPVLVPPLMEQRRIVDLLEGHLSSIDAGLINLDLVRAKAKSWAAAVIDRTFQEIDQRLAVGTLLREPMRNGHSASASSSGDVRTLTLTSVTKREFTEANTKMTSADRVRVRKLWLRSGDLLVQRSNTAELVGTCALYTGSDDWAIFPDLLIRLRADEEKILPGFLAAALASDRVHRELRGKAKGLAGSMPKIDQGAIAAQLVPCPDIETQRRILVAYDRLQSGLSRLLSDVQRIRDAQVALRAALLAAAFSGKLAGSHSLEERHHV
jgi:type I restriction enzyme, S subunit